MNLTNRTFRKIGPIALPIRTNGSKIVNFDLVLYVIEDRNYHVLTCQPLHDAIPTIFRIESACSFAHLYGSMLCDCEQQLKTSLKIIGDQGGILIYALDQHGRGVGLANHVRVYQVEQTGIDTVDAHRTLGLEVDARQYWDILDILSDMNISRVRLLTNNPARHNFFESHLEFVERTPLEQPLNHYSVRELMIKKEKMGHLYAFKSDLEWINELSAIDKACSFALIKNAESVLFRGELKNLGEFLKREPHNDETFYTIYCFNKTTSPDEIFNIVKFIRDTGLASYHLRMVFRANLDVQSLKKLYTMTINSGFLEFKCLSEGD